MINIKNYWAFEIAGFQIIINETILNTWIIMLLLIVLAVVVRIALRKFTVVPSGYQNAVEAVVEMFDNFASNTLGPKLSYIAPWYFMVFGFILVSSMLSVVGLRAPTADFATTFALAIATFFIMFFMGLKHRKGSYLKGFFEPNIVFFPLNLIGEIAKPISLSFRLFGNMLSGTILLTLYYTLTPRFVQVGIPAMLHAVFDVLFGALQTYIFVIISLMYIKGAAE